MNPAATLAAVRGPMHSASVRGQHVARRRRRSVQDVLLGVLAVVGVVSVLWLIAAWALHLSIIVFVTGSMGPSLPTGSAAIVQEVTAAELRVGDIVTVPKPDSGMPVTHRIVEIAPAAGSPGAVDLSLKGDANDVVDPITYTVSDARRLVVGAPFVGSLMVWAKTPVVMLTASLCISAAIAWALWPSRRTTDS